MLQKSSTDLIKIIAVKNPFDHNSRVTKSFSYEGRTVQSYVKELYPEVFQDFEVVASVDGRVIDPVLTIPAAGSFVVFCLSPGDNDTGRMMAMLAVMAISIYFFGPGGAAGLTGQTGAFALAGSMVAGTLLVNALLPVVPDDIDLDQGSSYGWTSVNNIDEGSTAPVIYGTVKVLPYLIGKYISNEWVPGINTPDRQRMNLLYLIADHAVDSIESIKLNGNPYDGYNEVSVQKRYGTNDQSVIGSFRDTHTQQGYGVLITTSWTELDVPGSDNTGIGVGMGLPKGLAAYYDNPEPERLGATQTIQYRLQDESDAGWTTLQNGIIEGKEKVPLKAHWQVVDLTPGAYKIRFYTTTPSDTKHVRDQVIDYVEGIVQDDFRYPGNSLLAVNAVATDQLSGGLPVLSCVVSRNYVSVWTGSGWEDKPASIPAWACYDMLVNDEYGGGISYTKMIYADFATWADFCVTNSYFCHIVIDVTTSFPEALAKVSIIGRGHVIQKGTKFSVIIDQEDDPVQLFGIGNIIEGTFKQSYLGKNSRANSIAITYFDASKDYERLSFELRSSDFDTASSVEPEKLELTLHGATSKELAIKHGKFLLNCNEYLIRFVEFEVNVDALASNVGEVIYVSHDVPQWGYSGHVVSATSNTIVIDREVTMTPGTTYHILVRHYDDDDLEEVAIVNPETGVATASLSLSGTWGQIPAADDVYAFGEITKVAKQFRITNISRSQEMIRRIQALEYRSEVYSDSATVPDYESETALEPYVAGLQGVEVYKTMGGLRVAFISLTWWGFGLHYLYMKEDVASKWSLVSTHAGNNWADIWKLEAGKTYYFAVSTTANPADGDVISMEFVGWTASINIWNVTGLQIDGQPNNTVWQNKNLKIKWNMSTDTFPDEADGDPAGASTFPPMSEFGGYRIKITDSTGTLRREIIQIENSYNYSFERNSEDGDGTPEPNLIVQVWARDIYGRESDSPATISASNPAPAAPSGLTATPHMKSIVFSWQKNTEIDIDYYKYRTKIETDEWSDWSDEFEGTEKFVSLTTAEQAAFTTEASIYFEVKAFDTFGNASSASSTNATTEGLNVESSDIGEYAITASKIWAKIIILTGDSWTDNSPVSGSIAWNAHTVIYNGASYSIEAGSTSLQYVWWDGESSAYSVTNTNPTLSDGQFMIATNVSGAHDLAWHGMANASIGSAYVQNAAILAAHILELDADKMRVGTLTGINIIGNMIRTSADAKAVIITDEGIRLQTDDSSAKYGQIKYGGGVSGEKYGSGVLAYIHHTSKNVPFYVSTPTIYGDYHYAERTSTPTGPAEVGDTCVVNGLHYTCTIAGTPGTWTVTGDQTAP